MQGGGTHPKRPFTCESVCVCASVTEIETEIEKGDRERGRERDTDTQRQRERWTEVMRGPREERRKGDGEAGGRGRRVLRGWAPGEGRGRTEEGTQTLSLPPACLPSPEQQQVGCCGPEPRQLVPLPGNE